MMQRWVQNMSPPRNHTAEAGSPESARATRDVTGSSLSSPPPSPSILEAPKMYSLTMRPAMKPRMRRASQEGVSRSGFTTRRSQRKYATPTKAKSATTSLAKR